MSSGSYYEEEMSSGGHRRLTAFILWPSSPFENLPSIHHHHGAGWALTYPSPWSWLGAYRLTAFILWPFPLSKISPRSTSTRELAGRLPSPWSWLGAYIALQLMSAWVRGNLLWKGRIFKKKSEIPQSDLTKPNIEGQV